MRGIYSRWTIIGVIQLVHLSSKQLHQQCNICYPMKRQIKSIQKWLALSVTRFSSNQMKAHIYSINGCYLCPHSGSWIQIPSESTNITMTILTYAYNVNWSNCIFLSDVKGWTSTDRLQIGKHFFIIYGKVRCE